MESSGHRGLSEYARSVRYPLFIIALLLLFGCEEKREVYSRFLTTETLQVGCIRINPDTSYAPLLESGLKAEGFSVDPGCPYRVKVIKNFATCSNPSPEASRGFMRLELSVYGKSLYQVQQEFYQESDDVLIANLTAYMAKELRTPSP